MFTWLYLAGSDALALCRNFLIAHQQRVNRVTGALLGCVVRQVQILLLAHTQPDKHVQTWVVDNCGRQPLRRILRRTPATQKPKRVEFCKPANFYMILY